MELQDGWNNRILIVDDAENIHRDLELILTPGLIEASTDDLAREFGSNEPENFLPEFEFLHAMSGKEAYEKVKTALEEDNPIAVVYMDIRMPGDWDGVEAARRIREIDRNIEIVIMTALDKRSLPEITDDMEMLHRLLYLRKPLPSREEIQQLTIALVEKWNVERRLDEKTQQLEAVLYSTDDAIAMFGTSGNLLFANRWYAKMFGLTYEELRKMSADELRQEIRQYFQVPDQFEKAEADFYADPENFDAETIGQPVELRIPERKVIHQLITPAYDADEEHVIGHLVVYREAAKEIEIAKLTRENLRLKAEVTEKYIFDNIIGMSRKMQNMYALMEQAIRSDITVLVLGESGTGKELVAKSIHFNSSRRDKPFIAVNCAAIPETLIESELFGHERGAFTGASARRIGRFEQADGGTILLDEIGEMPLPLQARLLRVLQERELQRVGGASTIPIDVRVIASTNRNLEEAMKAGEFREDLFYRVAAFPITIAPLRERPEDIPPLAEHFLGPAAERNGNPGMVISREALQALMNYHWPGNVRELENVIERAVLLETSGILKADSLPPEIYSARRASRIQSTQDEEITVSKILPLEEVEKQAIIRALEATGNNIRQAARMLGINRATVYRKMEKYNLAEKG